MHYDIGNTTAATLQAKPTPLKWGNGNYGATADEAGYVAQNPAHGWNGHPNRNRI